MTFGLVILQHFDYGEITELIEGLQTYAIRKGDELSKLYDQAEQDPELNLNQEYKDWVLGRADSKSVTGDLAGGVSMG